MRLFLTWLILFIGVAKSIYAQKSPLLEQGIDAYNKGNFDEAATFFKNAILQAEKERDSLSLQTALTNLGNAYSIIGKIESALDYYQQAAAIAEKRNDPDRLAKTLKNIGTLYSEQKEFDKALEQFDRAEIIALKIGAEDILADCHINRAIVYEFQNRYQDAVHLYQTALSYYEKNHVEERMALTYNNLGVVNKLMGDLHSSYFYYKRTMEIADRLGDQFIIAASLTNMANVRVLTKQYDEALLLNTKALSIAKEIEATGIEKDIYDNMAELYAAKGDFRNAFLYLQKYIAANSELLNVERSAQLAEMHEKYETEKKDTENAVLRQEGEIKALKIQEQNLLIERRNLLLLISFSFFGLSVLSVFFYLKWQKGKNLRAKEEAIRISKEQQRQRFAQDLHDDLGAGISRLRVISSLALQKAENTLVQSDIRSLAYTAGTLVSNMRDMLWAMNPEHTTISFLISRLREHSAAYFENLPIIVKFIAPSPIPEIKITAEQNRNIFLIVKESFQNIIKHANASEVHVVVEIENTIFTLSITDNGTGLIPDSKLGHGLQNMEKRAQQINSTLKIKNRFDGGVSLTLTLTLQAA